MRWLLAYAGTCTLLVGVAFGALWVFEDGQDIGLSLHGVIALVLAIVLTSAVGIGLMALLFHSSRSGHDDEVGVFKESDD
ncbi:MAG TPA: hypothetical protein VGE72_25220 [Azospirillum sp.]